MVRQMSLPKEMREILVALAPELAEIEDERIRKEIIHYILYKANGVSEKQEHEWIAYLEKQKEQKPVPISCGHEKGTPAEVCYGPKGDPDPAVVWKPSEEQMRALEDTLSDMPEYYKPKCTLETLLRDLKKL